MSAMGQPSPLAPTQSNATLEERLIEQARALIPTLRSRERAAIEAGHAPTLQDLAAMAARQLVTVAAGESGAIHVTEPGRRAYIVVLSTDGRIASKALTGFTPQEIADFGGYLRRAIQNTNRGAPNVWTYSGIAEHPLADQA